MHRRHTLHLRSGWRLSLPVRVHMVRRHTDCSHCVCVCCAVHRGMLASQDWTVSLDLRSGYSYNFIQIIYFFVVLKFFIIFHPLSLLFSLPDTFFTIFLCAILCSTLLLLTVMFSWAIFTGYPDKCVLELNIWMKCEAKPRYNLDSGLLIWTTFSDDCAGFKKLILDGSVWGKSSHNTRDFP